MEEQPIYNVNVAFNVQAATSEEAWSKLVNHLRSNFTGTYQSVEEPELQPHLTAADCESLLT
jgi:hypothetical protein